MSWLNWLFSSNEHETHDHYEQTPDWSNSWGTEADWQPAAESYDDYCSSSLSSLDE